MTGSTEIQALLLRPDDGTFQALLRPDDGTFQVVPWGEPGQV
ncbi:hypothetical protein LTSEJOH_2513 [Salmonella enterica subsp. enterica serovar Johannesburg str. S5-703]|nr:hypothetical protein LTSEJOH_2513 [Salmonella enterica subsp. enterica serovar Johannesburg str. S5-703]